MTELTQDQVYWLWFLAKLTAPMLVAWAIDRASRKRNPRWRVDAWRISVIASLVIVLAGLAPPLTNWQLTVDTPVNDTLAMELKALMAPTQLSNGESVLATNTPPKLSHSPIPVALPHATPLQANVMATVAIDNPVSSEVLPQPTKGGKRSIVNGSFLLVVAVWSIYLLGIAVWLVRHFVARRFAQQLLRESTAPSQEWTDWVAVFAKQLGIRPVNIRASDAVRSPSVLGLRRPTILLPTNVATAIVPSAIAHEMVHVASRDLWWDAALRWCQSLAWPHPLAWKAVVAHRAACESVSDLVAADLLNDRVAYRTSLAQIVLSLEFCSASRQRGELRAVTMPMARRAQIVDRLRIIASDIKAHSISRYSRWATLITLLACTILGSSSLVLVSDRAAAQPPVSENQAASQKKPGEFVARALADESGQPLAGARFELLVCSPRCVSQTVTADINGVMTLPLPVSEAPYSISGTVYHRGRVPTRIQTDNVQYDAPPIRQKVRLSKGVVAKGMVVDENDQPIEGATVSSVYFQQSGVFYSIFRQTTGPDGRWEMDSVNENAHISVEHDDYVNASFQTVRDRDTICRLSLGKRLKLIVRDPDGTPVANARVSTSPSSLGMRQRTTTNPEGRFECSGLSDQPFTVMVTAEGFAPLRYKVDENRDPDDELELRLTTGGKFQLLVLDEARQPIPGAYVTVHSDESGFDNLWNGTTGADGVATWNGATEKTQRTSISAKGYVAISKEIDTSQAIEVILKSAPTLRGRAIDQATGDPLREFSVRVARRGHPNSMFHSDAKTTGRDGVFELPLGFEIDDLIVVVSADGYESWQYPLTAEALSDEIVAKLTTATSLTGSVADADGMPVAGADVLLTDAASMMPIRPKAARRIGFRVNGDTFSPLDVRSDNRGSFTFALDGKLPEAAVLFVEHEKGFAQSLLNELDVNRLLKLEPWTNLEVIVSRNGEPVVGQKIDVRYMVKPRLRKTVKPLDETRVTDENGRAYFDKLRPWEVMVSVSTSPTAAGTDARISSAAATRQDKYITLLPTPNQLLLGGDSVRLEARIIVPPDPQFKDKPEFTETGIISGMSLSDGPYNLAFKPDSAGRIVVESIPPGSYNLRVPVRTKVPAEHSGNGTIIDTIAQEFQVPADATAPLELSFECRWPHRVAVGDPAQPFVGRLGNGNVLSSKSLVGKWLLLDWFSSDSVMYNQQLPGLIAAYAKWKKQGLEIVSFASSFQIADMNSEPTASGNWQRLPWPIITDYETNSLTRGAYSIGSSPSRILINPAGQIVYRGSDWASLEKAVNTALAAQKNANGSPTNMSRGGLSGVTATPIADDAFVASDVVVACIQRLPAKLSPSTMNFQQSMRSLNLYSESGQLVRTIPLAAESHLPRQGLWAMDQQRDQLYVVNGSELLAISRQAKLLYRVSLAELRSIAVDQTTGEIWCCCGDRRSGWTIILDSSGTEVRRIPVAANDVVASATSSAAWLFGQDLKLISNTGDILRQPPYTPVWVYTTDAVIDQRGQPWVIGIDRPEGGPSSRTALWRLTESGFQITGDYQTVNANDGRSQPKGLFPSGVETVGNEVLVHAYVYSGEPGAKPKSHTERYTPDGESLGIVDIDLGVFASCDTGIWSIRDDHLAHFSPKYEQLSSVRIDDSSAETDDTKGQPERLLAF